MNINSGVQPSDLAELHAKPQSHSQSHSQTIAAGSDELKVAQEFEALFLQRVLKHMRNAGDALQGDEPLLGGREEKFYREMHDQQLAQHLAQRQGLGLAEIMARQLGGEAPAPATPPMSQTSTQVTASVKPDSALKPAPESVALTKQSSTTSLQTGQQQHATEAVPQHPSFFQSLWSAIGFDE